MPEFRLQLPFEPAGDQPAAIEALTEGVLRGDRHQVLLGATGTGKTFTIANVIANTQRPTLVLSHNKTLAAQLFGELKKLFPDNAVEYFVSYYDYYQPEAYVASSDTYIQKDALINERIDKLRHAATRSLLERDDVIIVSSVSCIYGLGSREAYDGMLLQLAVGQEISRRDILTKLVEILYERNESDFHRGTSARGGTSSRSSPRTRTSWRSVSSCSATRSSASASSTGCAASGCRTSTASPSTPRPTTSPPSSSSTARSRPSRTSCSCGSPSCASAAGCSRPSASRSGPCSTWR